MSQAIQEMKDHNYFLERTNGSDLTVNATNVEAVEYDPVRNCYVVYMVSYRQFTVKNSRRLPALVNELNKRG